MPIQFDKKISIDGVAVILAAVAAIFWFARLEGKVEDHTSQIAEHKLQLDKLSDNQSVLQQNLAVLTAIQKEKDKKP